MPAKKTATKAKKIEFKFRAPAGAKKVLLAGDFTNWEKGAILMKPQGKIGEWIARVDLTPGEHEYKFMVDGIWHNDPNARQKPNMWGSENSVIDIH